MISDDGLINEMLSCSVTIFLSLSSAYFLMNPDKPMLIGYAFVISIVHFEVSPDALCLKSVDLYFAKNIDF